MKSKIMMLMLALCLFALSAPAKDAWMHYDKRYVDWFQPKVLTINGEEMYIASPTPQQYEENGIVYIETPDVVATQMFFDYENRKIFEIFSEETNSVVPIDTTTYQSGLQFAYVLDMYFPNIGAVTNRFITETYVTDFFAAKLLAKTITAEDLGYVTMLDRLFTILKDSPFNPSPGTTWDFPFGRSQIIVPTTRRYYIDDKEIKHYLD